VGHVFFLVGLAVYERPGGPQALIPRHRLL
jgi:hypothetical protein